MKIAWMQEAVENENYNKKLRDNNLASEVPGLKTGKTFLQRFDTAVINKLNPIIPRVMKMPDLLHKLMWAKTPLDGCIQFLTALTEIFQLSSIKRATLFVVDRTCKHLI